MILWNNKVKFGFPDKSYANKWLCPVYVCFYTVNFSFILLFIFDLEEQKFKDESAVMDI